MPQVARTQWRPGRHKSARRPVLRYVRSGSRGAEGFGAVGAGADAAEMIVAVDAGCVAVAEGNLNGVIADLRGSLRARLGLEHRQRGSGGVTRAGRSALSDPLVIASGAGTFLAKISEIVVAGVTIGPRNVDAGAAAHMNFHRGGLFAGIKGDGHRVSGKPSSLALAVAAIARRDGVAMRTRFRVAQKTANALIELRADDVLELASLVASLGVFDRESVLE